MRYNYGLTFGVVEILLSFGFCFMLWVHRNFRCMMMLRVYDARAKLMLLP